jgi:hypothetical protein
VPEIGKVGDLEIDQDLDFQQKEWSVERWGWVLMALLAIAGLLGLFGQGPLSRKSAANGPVKVEYGRFERLLAPVEWNLELDQQMLKNGEARVRVDKSLLNQYNIQRIEPQPESEEVAPDHVIFVFQVPQGGKGITINFNLQPIKLGPASGQVGQENGPMLPVNQFIYP